MTVKCVEPIYEIYFGPNSHFEGFTEGRKFRITGNTIKHNGKEVFKVAEFVLKMISTLTLTNNGPWGRGLRQEIFEIV